MSSTGKAAFGNLVDLASEKLGGKALATSDDFFAEKENLVKASPAVFLPDEYTDRGKWMDGWESRRKRVPGYDWCIVQLGAPGVIAGLDIDTSFFLGNHPPFASLEALCLDGSPDVATLTAPGAPWKEILSQAPLAPGSQNVFGISSTERFTHVRLNIYPDGGVARLRVYGTVAPDWGSLPKGEDLDLAAVVHGGVVVGCSDMFFGSKDNMIMPGRARNMGDGWETRRKRAAGPDWAVVRLGARGTLARLELDTQHFKGNFPHECRVEGLDLGADRFLLFAGRTYPWQEIVPLTRMKADHRHFFEDLKGRGPFTHIRIESHPDGGLARFRAWGRKA